MDPYPPPLFRVRAHTASAKARDRAAVFTLATEYRGADDCSHGKSAFNCSARHIVPEIPCRRKILNLTFVIFASVIRFIFKFNWFRGPTYIQLDDRIRGHEFEYYILLSIGWYSKIID